MNFNIMAKIEQTVFANLGAQVIAVVPNAKDDIVREGYEERSFIVTWKRPLRVNVPDMSGDGFSYATHRVHVNSNGDSACFIGNYDQTRSDALLDMLNRAGMSDRQKDNKIKRLERDLQLSVCYSPQAIRDSYDSHDDDDKKRVWVEQATEEQLLEVASMIVNSDPTWSDFHENIEMCIEEIRKEKSA